jgi:hypothetical protein
LVGSPFVRPLLRIAKTSRAQFGGVLDRAEMPRTSRIATIFGGAVMKKMKLSLQPSTGLRNYPEYTIAPISNYPSPGQPEAAFVKSGAGDHRLELPLRFGDVAT